MFNDQRYISHLCVTKAPALRILTAGSVRFWSPCCPKCHEFPAKFHENPSVVHIISTVQEYTIRSGLRLLQTVRRLQRSHISRDSENYECVSDLCQRYFIRKYLCASSVCIVNARLRLRWTPNIFSCWAQKCLKIFRRHLKKLFHLTRNKRRFIVPDTNILMI